MKNSQQGAAAFQFLALSFVVTIPYANLRPILVRALLLLLFILQGLVTGHKGRMILVVLALLVLLDGLKQALSAEGVLGWPRNVGSCC